MFATLTAKLKGKGFRWRRLQLWGCSYVLVEVGYAGGLAELDASRALVLRVEGGGERMFENMALTTDP
jgi:hypothetical protein